MPKTGAAETLLLACGVVASGGVYVPPHALLALHDGGAPVAPTAALTRAHKARRAALLMDGEPNKRIAQRLVTEDQSCTSPRCCGVLQARNRTEAVAGASVISKGIAQVLRRGALQRRSSQSGPRVITALRSHFQESRHETANRGFGRYESAVLWIAAILMLVAIAPTAGWPAACLPAHRLWWWLALCTPSLPPPRCPR